MKKVSEKKPASKEEIMDEIIPIRSVEKTAAKLRELKASQEKNTVPYNSKNYGFSKPLVLFLAPGLSKEQVKAKFEARFNATTINGYNIKKGLKV